MRELPPGPIVDLCQADGRLNPAALGWSRQPRHRSNLRGPWLRQKRWNAWGITTPRHYLLVGVMNLDYAAIGSTYLYDFTTGQFLHQGGQRLLASAAGWSDTALGPCHFRGGPLEITSEPVGPGTRLSVRGERAKSGPIEIDLEIKPATDQQSLNLVIPWSERRYHFTSKQACLPAGGTVRWGQHEIRWAPGEALAWLDYARGVWPYRSGWRWAMCSARVGDRLVGFNLGAGWTDGTGVNENALYVDGRVVKIADPVVFRYDRSDRGRPWQIHSVDSDQVRLEFRPVRQHVDGMNLGIIRASLHQVLGHYHGSLTSDTGERLTIDGAVGVAEDHQARW